MKKIIFILIASLLMASCAGGSYTTKNKGCKGGGWYAKDRNLSGKHYKGR